MYWFLYDVAEFKQFMSVYCDGLVYNLAIPVLGGKFLTRFLLEIIKRDDVINMFGDSSSYKVFPSHG